MSLENISRWQKLVGKVGALVCLLFFFAAGDAIVSQTRQPMNLIELIPGASQKFNFSLKDKVEDVRELTHLSSSELVTALLETVHKGFWLGGYMCQGQASASLSAKPGDYSIRIFPKGKTTAPPLYEFKVRVYRDPDDFRQHSKSLLYRQVGISPWKAMVCCVFLSLTAAVCVFLISRKREYLLQQRGQAEIYQAALKNTGYEISFGLGKQHDIRVGMRLDVHDEEGNPIGAAKVIEVFEKDAKAEIVADKVRPGYMVSKH